MGRFYTIIKFISTRIYIKELQITITEKFHMLYVGLRKYIITGLETVYLTYN